MRPRSDLYAYIVRHNAAVIITVRAPREPVKSPCTYILRSTIKLYRVKRYQGYCCTWCPISSEGELRLAGYRMEREGPKNPPHNRRWGWNSSMDTRSRTTKSKNRRTPGSWTPNHADRSVCRHKQKCTGRRQGSTAYSVRGEPRGSGELCLPRRTHPSGTKAMYA